jgi:hypothetical protein
MLFWNCFGKINHPFVHGLMSDFMKDKNDVIDMIGLRKQVEGSIVQMDHKFIIVNHK